MLTSLLNNLLKLIFYKTVIMKKYSILTAGILGILSVSGSMYAQDSVADSLFTLEQCKQMALENNSDIHVADNNLCSAIETRREAFTKYFPEVSAGASAFRANHDMIQYDVLDLFTLGIINKGKTAGVWAMQPIFMGGQIVNGNKLAKVGEEVARIRKRQSADLVQLQTETIYWKLVTLNATKQTLESAITVLDSLGLQVKAAVDAGVAMMNDYLKVELKRNSYRADLVDLENGIELMTMLLAQQMGLGTDTRIRVLSEIPDTVPNYPAAVYINPSDALMQTSDHKLLVKNVEAKLIEKRMEVGNNLPKLAVGAGLFYHDMFNQSLNFAGIMVALSVPLSGWWGGSYAIKRKSHELNNARIELDNMSQKLEIEMSDKWDNLTAAHRKMIIAYEAIAQSEENLRLNKAYYDAGMCTITDLLDAQALDRQAKDDYIAAYGAFRMSKAQYLNATGRID